MFEVDTFNPHQTGAFFSWLVLHRGPCEYVCINVIIVFSIANQPVSKCLHPPEFWKFVQRTYGVIDVDGEKMALG
jgi:hypothetical protein